MPSEEICLQVSYEPGLDVSVESQAIHKRHGLGYIKRFNAKERESRPPFQFRVRTRR